MASFITLVCDRCGFEQKQDDTVYWAERLAKVSWKVPPDGGNGGDGEPMLCKPCRVRVFNAICVAMEKEAP